jgi:acetyl-CoA acyltransferase
MREAVIVAGTRTAVGKAKRGVTRHVRSDDMAATVIQELMKQTDGKLDPQEIDDVIMGCAMPEGAQGMNFARVIALRAGLPVEVPGQTVNRFCSSGLQSIAMAAERIIANGEDVIIAGGAETMSLVPMTGFRLSPNPHMAMNEPEVYMSMGHTAEHVADEFGISREDMDEFAYNSHMRAAAATDAGKFAEEIVPFEIEETIIGEDGLPVTVKSMLKEDEHLRRDTSVEGLEK